jgi:acetolactate synthase regulatory subunit
MTRLYEKQNKNKKNKWFSIKILIRILLLLIIIEGVYYMASINDLVVKGFKLQELKTYSNNLANENRNINIQVTSLKSYNSLAKRIEELKMVSAIDIDYIKVNKGELAIK